MNAMSLSRGAGRLGIAVVVAIVAALVLLLLLRSPIGPQPASAGLHDMGPQVDNPGFATPTDSVVQVALPSVPAATPIAPVATPIEPVATPIEAVATPFGPGTIVSGGLVVGLPGFDPPEPMTHPDSSPCDPETQDCG